MLGTRLSSMKMVTLIFSLAMMLSAASECAFAVAEPAKKEGEGEAAAPAEPIRSTGYVHKWIKTPTISVKSIVGGSTVSISAEEGVINIYVFLASWCEPCQAAIDDFKHLQNRFKNLHVKFYYIFAHDAVEDAEGFLEEHEIKDGYLANYDTLKTFHNPELPSIYLGDRHGWLAHRVVKPGAKDFSQLGELLKYLTAL